MGLMKKCALLVGLAACCPAQLPECYRAVSRVTWVTRDARRAAEQWTRFGLENPEPHGDVSLPVEHRGRPSTAKVRWVAGWMGDIALDFLQPLEGGNPYAEFLSRYGEGVFGLLHEAGSPEAFNAEIARMRKLGVGELMRAGDFLYFDTLERGKYALGLVVPDALPKGAGRGPIVQFAFAVRDLKPVSEFWARLGFPAMTITRSQSRDMTYRGTPGQFEQVIGWQRHGRIPYEWCVPPQGTGTVYEEHIRKHGEGFQHFGFSVPDMNAAIREKGFPVAQAGAWGEEGKKGSGRYAYLDTTPAGGVTAELLWSFR
jgi:methylmalonyl-CoA/ethylmalonyl-CoA epimerase